MAQMTHPECALTEYAFEGPTRLLFYVLQKQSS